MKKIIALIAALTMILGMTLLSSPAEASKDITWGKVKAEHSKDITWGKVRTVPLNKVLTKKAWGTAVTHAADDSGWALPIHVVCVNGADRYLGLGESTFMSTNKACDANGVQTIVVPANHTVYCKNYVPPYENTYYYFGRTSVPSNRTYKCYDQKAL